VLILFGGIAAGQLVPVAVAAVLLALAFLGLAHALVEGLFGKARESPPHDPPKLRSTAWLTGTTAVGLASLSVAAYALPGSAIAAAIGQAAR
jgi:hypothetical protein